MKKLTDTELLSALKYGIKTKLKGLDKKLETYKVLDFDDEELLICYGGISWQTGETSYTPHTIKVS